MIESNPNGSRFGAGNRVFIKNKDGNYVHGTIQSIVKNYVGNSDPKLRKIQTDYQIVSIDSTGPEFKYISIGVREKDNDKFVYSLNDFIKPGARVSVTRQDLNRGLSAHSEHLQLDESITRVYGTLIDCHWVNTNYPVILFDDGAMAGLPIEKMGEVVRDAPAIQNIPNLSNRRFCCLASELLTFHTDSDSLFQTRENTMSNKIVEVLKGDAKEAAYRVAGTQITNGVKLGVVKLFEKKGGSSDQMDMLRGLLDSEVGDSIIALILGYGLTYAPGLKDDPRVQKLSAEFRVNGMAVAGNAVMGAAMESILPVLSSALQALPAEETSKPRITESSEEHEEEDVVPPARASKRAGG